MGRLYSDAAHRRLDLFSSREPIDYTRRMPQRSRPVMTLVVERRLSDLITPPAGSEVLEASGVVAKDGFY